MEMPKILFTIFFTLATVLNALSQKAPDNTIKGKFHPGVMVIKFKSASAAGGRVAFSRDEMLRKVKKVVDYQGYKQVFKSKKITNARVAASHLENIYKLQIPASVDIKKKINELLALGFIEYAEPLYRHSLLYIPNDPEAQPDSGLQDYLSVIRAYEAWDVEKSDTSMVIGIVDTGIKFDHEDLGNVAYNYADPVNGLDDDNDGYVDNYRGWDVANDDNDPTADADGHGVLVTGVAAAKTDNGIGMAGMGFNSRFLPVNIMESSTRFLINEYEGVIYAADHGCKIINLSWGGIDYYSAFAQDVINYAVLEKDAVVIAAGGNKHGEFNYYPASYDHVLSVGPVDLTDSKPAWGTYSYHIDLTAPAKQIFSTKNNGAYGRDGGTSYASPMVAGTAALVRAHFPEMTALQVMEQIRVTSDDVYDVGNNMDYYGMLGHGRLNMHSALTDTITPSVRINKRHYQGSHGQLIFPGDTVTLSFELINYLRTAGNLNVKVSNPSANVAMVSGGDYYADRLGELETLDIHEDPVIFVVNNDVTPGERLLFRLDMTADNYTDFEYIQLFATPEYLDISDSVLTATISGSGDIGYTGPDYGHGSGITFNGETVASHAGLIISSDSLHVPDNVVSNFSLGIKNTDFESEAVIRVYDNSTADADARTVFSPVDSLNGALNVRIEQKTLAWQHTGDYGYLVFEYRLINTGDTAFNNLNAGMYVDWDMGDYQSNMADWDSLMNLAYVYDKQAGNRYAGLALLSDQSLSYRAVDLDNLNGNTAELDSLFSDVRKHEFLANISSKKQAGVAGAGNDVAHVLGAKGLKLENGKTTKVVIAMLAANSLGDLKAALDSARANYQQYLQNPPLAETFYACSGDSAVVDPAGEIYEFYKDPQLTQRIDSGRFFKTAPVFHDTVFYAVNLDSGYVSDAMSLAVRVGDPVMGFEYFPDTMDMANKYVLTIADTGSLYDTLRWFVNDVFMDSGPFFKYNYGPQPFVVKQVKAAHGCYDTLAVEVVPAPSPLPGVSSLTVCKNAPFFIEPANGSIFFFYADAALQQLLHKGAVMTVPGIDGPVTYYVTGIDSLLESDAAMVEITPDPVKAVITVTDDTVNLSRQNTVELTDNSENAVNSYWLLPGGAIDTVSVITETYEKTGIYDYDLVAESSMGCRDTAFQKIVAVSITGLGDELGHEKISIFPNPVSAELLVELKESGNESYMLALTDLSGNIISEFQLGKGSPSGRIDMAKLPQGVYFLKISDGKSAYTAKIIRR